VFETMHAYTNGSVRQNQEGGRTLGSCGCNAFECINIARCCVCVIYRVRFWLRVDLSCIRCKRFTSRVRVGL
jgi:hypothetical protein